MSEKVITHLTFGRMSRPEKDYVEALCRSSRMKTASGRFRMRKMKDKFEAKFGIPISYDAFRGAVYVIVQERKIERPESARRRVRRSHHMRESADSLLARMDRYEKRAEESERLVSEMRENMSELMRIIKG